MADKKAASTDVTAGKKASNNPEQPVVQLIGQYLKDASFECHAPAFVGQQPKLRFDFEVGVNIFEPAEHLREVAVKLKGVANNEDNKALYIAENTVAIVFHIEHLTKEQYVPMLAIDGAAMVYPFARQVMLSAIADGGYPTPVIGPVDFRAMFEAGSKEDAKE